MRLLQHVRLRDAAMTQQQWQSHWHLIARKAVCEAAAAHETRCTAQD